MSKFQVLHKTQNIYLTSKENFNFNCKQYVESRRVKRSQVFDSRRGFVFQEPLKPVKEKTGPTSNNILYKYKTKKVPHKKQPPPFIVGKVRHKIHSPPFLHGPKISTEPKKRVPMTSLQSFAPKNYKFKANYISKAPLTPIKMSVLTNIQNDQFFTPKKQLYKNIVKKINKDKESCIENKAIQSNTRKVIENLPTISIKKTKTDGYCSSIRNNVIKKPEEKPIFGRLNLEKNLQESNSVNIKSTVERVSSFQINIGITENMADESIKIATVEQLNTTFTRNQCPFSIYTSPKPKDKEFAERVSDNKDTNAVIKLLVLNQTAHDCNSTIRFVNNQNDQEYRPKLADISNSINSLNEKSLRNSEIKQYSFEYSLLQKQFSLNNVFSKQGEISRTSMNDASFLIDNDIGTNSSDFNQICKKDVIETGLNLLTQSPLLSSKKHENASDNASSEQETCIFSRISPQLLKNTGDDFLQTQQSPLKILNLRKRLVYVTPSPTKRTSKGGIARTPTSNTSNLIINDFQVSPSINAISSDFNQTCKKDIETKLNLLSENASDNASCEKGEIARTPTNNTPNLIINDFQVSPSINAISSDFNQTCNKDIEPELNLLSENASDNASCEKETCVSSLASPHLYKNTNIDLPQAQQSPLRILNLRKRLVYVTPSPTKRTPKKKNTTPYKSSKADASDEHKSPLKELNLHKQQIASVNSSPSRKLTPRGVHAGNTRTPSVVTNQEVIDLIVSPEIEKSSVNKLLEDSKIFATNDKSIVETIDLLSDEEEESSKLLANILKKYSKINTPSSKLKESNDSTLIQNLPILHASPSKSPNLSKIINLCKQNIIITPSSKKSTPKRENALTYKLLQESQTFTVDQKQRAKTIDLLSDEENETSIFLANILNKYSTASPKSQDKNILSPTQKIQITRISPSPSPCLLKVLTLRNRNVIVTPSPKKSTPRRKKNAVK